MLTTPRTPAQKQLPQHHLSYAKMSRQDSTANGHMWRRCARISAWPGHKHIQCNTRQTDMATHMQCTQGGAGHTWASCHRGFQNKHQKERQACATTTVQQVGPSLCQAACCGNGVDAPLASHAAGSLGSIHGDLRRSHGSRARGLSGGLLLLPGHPGAAGSAAASDALGHGQEDRHSGRLA